MEATRAAIAKRKAEAEKEAERAKEPVEAQVRNAPMIRICLREIGTHFMMNYEENFAISLSDEAFLSRPS